MLLKKKRKTELLKYYSFEIDKSQDYYLIIYKSKRKRTELITEESAENSANNFNIKCIVKKMYQGIFHVKNLFSFLL